MLVLFSAMLSVHVSVPAKTAPATALVSKDDVFSCESWCPKNAKDWVKAICNL